MAMISPIIRYVLLSTAVASIVAVIYLKGRMDCAQKHLRARAEAAEKWVDFVADAYGAASDRERDFARKEAQNKALIEDIAEIAGNENVEDDVCVSSGTLERLRNIQ